MSADIDVEAVMAAAHEAAARAYAPYSHFHVGAALLFADRSMHFGSNFENASYGLSLCAETAAVLNANQAGVRSGLLAVGIVGGPAPGGVMTPNAQPVTPCGRCRQILTEVAQLGGTDPAIYCGHAGGFAQHKLSALLPAAFGPANLG